MKNTKNYQYQEYEIIEKTELATDTILFRFEGKFDFIPGQFVQIALDRFGEATFAFCSDPYQKKFFEICVRGCGNTTNQMIKLVPGDKLKIRGPYGNGWPLAKMIGKNIVIIAGGMGLVPLRPLLFEIERSQKEFKKIFFVGGFKTPDHVLFRTDLFMFKKFTAQMEVYVERTTKDFWGDHGLITEGLRKIKYPPSNTLALLCGPDIMIPYCNEMLMKNGTAEKDIFISFERRMECGIGVCQHCNIGKYFVCKDGPIFSLDKIKNEIGK